MRFSLSRLSQAANMVRAKKFILERNFKGEAKESDLKLIEEDLPSVKENQFLAQAEWLSVDPYMRPYTAQLPPGSTMIGSQVAKVIESKHAKYPVGSYVVGHYGWRTHTVVSPEDEKISVEALAKTFKLPEMKLPRSLALGVAGMPGSTAYFGFLEICQPKPGEVVVVSTAAGAVGSIVGQIAKIKGCKVIGYTGSDEKVEWLKKIGFDHAYNYKNISVSKSLKEAAPNGVDCYFDNVGGPFSGEVIRHMKLFGRISCCGAISTYNDSVDNLTMAPAVQGYMITNQLRMEGFVVSRWFDRLGESTVQLGNWIAEGKLKYRETVYEGFDDMPKWFLNMLKGDNIGKAVVKA